MQGYEPTRIYRSIEEGFEMLKQGVRQVFYFDDFLGTTTFDEDSLERNEDKQLITFLQGVRNSAGEKKLVLTSRDYILKQAQISLESLGNADLKPHLCTVDLQNYNRLNRAEILYNHLYFSDLSKKHIADLIRNRRYLAVIDHPNYSPRVIEWMTQIKTRWPQTTEDFAKAFLKALDNPSDLWKHAFERNISPSAQQVLWVLLSLPSLVKVPELERAFLPFRRSMAEHFLQPMHAHDFHDAIEELEGTFISIDKLSRGVAVIRFYNPSIRDFLEDYLSEHKVVIVLLARSAQFFSQLTWLWGDYQIGFRRRRPIQIKPRYRMQLLKQPGEFVESLARTFYQESPAVDILARRNRRLLRLARRVLFLRNMNQILNDASATRLIEDAIPKLKVSAEKGKESSFDLMKLAKNLKGTPYFSGIKDSFLSSLNSLGDFERYLLFKMRYRDQLTPSDEAFVGARFERHYPGQDFSYIDSVEDYDQDDSWIDQEEWIEDESEEDEVDEVKEPMSQQPKRDPNEIIQDMFDSLSA